MRKSHGSQDQKQTAGKAKIKAADESRHSEINAKDEEVGRRSQASVSSVIGQVVTEDQYRSRVAQKAYELYVKRQATTELEDWIEAERLVKTELLAEGQWAGSV